MSTPVESVYERFIKLESKTWFRLVKVIYILFATLIFFAICAVVWDSKPYLTFDNERSYVKCDRDVSTQWIYMLDKNSWGLYGNFNSNESLQYYAVDSVRKMCSQIIDPKTGITTPLSYGEVPEYSRGNYKLNLYSKLTGDYSEWMQLAVISSVVFGLIFVVLIQAFYYIVTGKRMFRKIQKYKVLDI